MWVAAVRVVGCERGVVAGVDDGFGIRRLPGKPCVSFDVGDVVGRGHGRLE